MLSGCSLRSREVSPRVTQRLGPVYAPLFARYSEDRGQYYAPFYEFFEESVATRDPQRAIDITSHSELGQATLQASFYHRRLGEFFSAAGGPGDLSGTQRLSAQNIFLHLALGLLAALWTTRRSS